MSRELGNVASQNVGTKIAIPRAFWQQMALKGAPMLVFGRTQKQNEAGIIQNYMMLSAQ